MALVQVRSHIEFDLNQRGSALTGETLSLSLIPLQLLVEYLRMMKMAPLASIVDKIFELYVDEKDAGPLVLANLYLMAGGSRPFSLSLRIAFLDRTSRQFTKASY